LDTASSPKKRGAQPGNLNALRHGAYACRKQAAQSGSSLETEPRPGQRRLSLSGEIDYLRAYFYRLALSGAVYTSPEEIAATLRTLSIAAAAITRLIQSESWLSQAVGSQVQYDQLRKASDELDRAVQTLHSQPAADMDLSDLPGEDLSFEKLFPGAELLVRQLGIPLSELAAGIPPFSQPSVKSSAGNPLP
jgi:hypothetical protein